MPLHSGPVLKITDGSVSSKVEGTTLSLDAEAGEAKLQIGGATLTLIEQGDITLEGDGALTLEAATDLALKAGANAVFEAGAGAEITAAAAMDVKGAIINLN